MTRAAAPSESVLDSVRLRPVRPPVCGCCQVRFVSATRGQRGRTSATPQTGGTAGARHFVLGTDLGQTGNPTPPGGVQMFVAGLVAQGITRDEIHTMGREVSGALLSG